MRPQISLRLLLDVLMLRYGSESEKINYAGEVFIY